MYETFVNEEGKAETMWQPRPADPELEAEMLGRFIDAHGHLGRKVKLAAQKPDANQPQRASVQGEAVLVNDAFDRAWRRTGLALDRDSLLVTDRDRSQGVYYIRPAQAEMDKERRVWWLLVQPAVLAQQRQAGLAKAPLAGGDYQVQVKAVNDSSSQVLVLDKMARHCRPMSASRCWPACSNNCSKLPRRQACICSTTGRSIWDALLFQPRLGRVGAGRMVRIALRTTVWRRGRAGDERAGGALTGWRCSTSHVRRLRALAFVRMPDGSFSRDGEPLTKGVLWSECGVALNAWLHNP